MRVSELTILLGWFLAFSSSRLLQRQDDPNYVEPIYLFAMCIPTAYPADPLTSPYPCEIQTYLDTICSANASTRPSDLLYEQNCICNSVYFDVYKGCSNCFYVHGSAQDDPADTASLISSLSAAECNAGKPTAPFSELWPDTRTVRPPAVTSVLDQFPNNTAVSNYWTPSPRTATSGLVTKSVTAASHRASRRPAALVTAVPGEQ